MPNYFRADPKLDFKSIYENNSPGDLNVIQVKTSSEKGSVLYIVFLLINSISDILVCEASQNKKPELTALLACSTFFFDPDPDPDLGCSHSKDRSGLCIEMYQGELFALIYKYC